jgi:1-deoxy-D-xylulose-5-phosphate reductoisomerase
MKILLLGSTGSIGTSTINCIRRYPQRFELVGLAAHSNSSALGAQAREFGINDLCLGDLQAAEAFATTLGDNQRLYRGTDGLVELVQNTDYDILVNALVGSVGLRPTVAALKRNKRVALANKETLVVGGDYITTLLSQGMGSMVPIDSEHSAILQAMSGERTEAIESIILTASGGPFRDYPAERFATITPEDALKHPTWQMGAKITIDSATLMNKGFEVIEAHHIFHLPYERLRVCVHPQSIIHSLVEFHDGAMMAQMGLPDMELPIQYALSWPERLPLAGKRLDLATIGSLTFFEPDMARFPCLRLCLEAGKLGGTAPAVVNAVNEEAVKLFLSKRIGFCAIGQLIEIALERHAVQPADSLETIVEVDRLARLGVPQLLQSL